MRIQKLQLKNFRCFETLDITFPNSNLAIFIGLNGSGKTAIFNAIESSFANFPEIIVPRLTSDFDEKKFKELTQEEINETRLGEIKFSAEDISINASETSIESCLKNEDKMVSWKTVYAKNNPQSCAISITHQSNFTDKNQTHLFNRFICIAYDAVKTKANIHTIDWRGSYYSTFDKFKGWFIEEENIENELINDKKDFSFTNPKLNVIRKAMHLFLNELLNANFHDLKVKRIYHATESMGTYEEEIKKYESFLTIKHDDKVLKLTQLSAGQRILLDLVGDISYRLVISNRDLKENHDYSNTVLVSTGIVLIDEIDLHLHPQWQREVLPALQKTFPNIQFIVTTHSPLVLSKIDKDNIFILKNNKLYQPSSNSIGRDSSDILEEIMDISPRPKEIEDLSKSYFSLINKNLFDEANKVRQQLSEKLDPQDPIFIRADAVITRKKLLRQ